MARNAIPPAQISARLQSAMGSVDRSSAPSAPTNRMSDGTTCASSTICPPAKFAQMRRISRLHIDRALRRAENALHHGFERFERHRIIGGVERVLVVLMTE